MPFAELGPERVHYTIDGGGPGLVLLHGTAADGAQWAPFRDALAGRFTVVAPDLAGSGRTVDAGGALTVGGLADEVAAVVGDAGVGPVHVAGHSLGAVVAAAVGARHPSMVRSVAMHAGWMRSDARLGMLFGVWGEVLRLSPRAFADLILASALSPGYLSRLGRADLDAMAVAFTASLAPGTDRQVDLDGRIDIAAAVRRIVAPVLLVASAQDHVVTVEHHAALAGAVPHAVQVTVPGGHGAPLEAAAELLDAVSTFVSGVK